MQFVICIKNQDCDDLVLFKVYQVIADEKADKSNYIRLIDESGEDYLYPVDYFMSITLTEKIEQAILQVV
jgi:hypothetical protein